MHTMSHSQKATSKLGINKLSQYKAIIYTRKSGQKKGSIDVKVINGHLPAKFGPKRIQLVLGAYRLFQMFHFPLSSAWFPKHVIDNPVVAQYSLMMLHTLNMGMILYYFNNANFITIR